MIYYIFLIGILLICFFYFFYMVNLQHQKEKQKKSEEKERQEKDKKRRELLNEWNSQIKKLGFSTGNHVKIAFRSMLWVSNDNLYEAESSYSYVARYIDSKDSKHSVQYVTIPSSSIQYYTKEGDVQYTTEVSGGGGGGVSVTGTIVGGLLAGSTGAIIGSRKKTEEVKSDTVKHDSRQTLIRYYKGNQIFMLSYAGFDVYNYLLKMIPEKDLLTIQLNSNVSDNSIKNVKIDIDEKLATIKRLYENNLISKEEFESKKAEILSKI